MKESGAQPIEVSDMQPDMFRALLRYIYTDSSPASSSNQQDEEEEEGSQDNHKKVWELLMAADRYSVERLKLICERVLCKRLDVDNVAEMLGMADRHHCGTLKDACIEFMTTSQRMDQVKKSQGFLKLKASNPCLLVEVLEKSSKF
jgi:speckle-type POZ protein